MFRPVPMIRANILILDRDLAVVTKEIGRLGIMHLEEVGQTPGLLDMGWTPGEELEVVSRYQNAKRLLDEIIEDTEIPEDTPIVPDNFDVNPLKDIDALEEKIEGYHNRIKPIGDEVLSLRDMLVSEEDNLKRAKNMIGINADLERIRSLKTLHMSMGYFPLKVSRQLEEYITTQYTSYIRLDTRGDRELGALFCLVEDADKLEGEMKKVGFEPMPLPHDCSGSPEEAIKEIEARIENIKIRITESENKLRGFGWTERGEILNTKEHLETNLDILKAVKSMGISESTALITGWVPANKVDKLEETLKDTLKNPFYLSTTKPEEMDEVRTGRVKVPVIFKNPKFLAPFETLVTTYGPPNYNEIEPSSIIGMAFIILFGVMFGDVGHGLCLFLIGLFIKKKYEAAKDLGSILNMAGISSIFFGVLFGEVFGYHAIHYGFVFSPMENIDPLMISAIAFGIFFISIGLIINIINSIRARDFEEGLLESHGLAGTLFYWGAIFVIVVMFAKPEALNIPTWGIISIVGIPLLIIFLREPIYHLFANKRPLIKEPGEYFLGSLVEILDTCTGFLSNSVSFIRVAAFSLAHVALMGAILMLVEMLKKEGAFSLASILVMVGGNLLVIVLEGLVVSIQSVRLIYYEFFGKFYRGEGKIFSPMKIGAFGDEK